MNVYFSFEWAKSMPKIRNYHHPHTAMNTRSARRDVISLFIEIGISSKGTSSSISVHGHTDYHNQDSEKNRKWGNQKSIKWIFLNFHKYASPHLLPCNFLASQ